MRLFGRAGGEIAPGLSRLVAAQVAAGLMRNAEPVELEGPEAWAREMEEAAMRARAALTTIGLMVASATEDQRTLDVLNLLVADLEARDG